MHHLDDLIALTWFRTEGKAEIIDRPEAEKARQLVLKAQEKAVNSLWDLPFSFNVSLEKKNIERNAVSAQEILGFYRKEVEPAFSKLDERLQLICRLDWVILFYRAIEKIGQIPGARRDRSSVEYVKALGLSTKYRQMSARYRELESQTSEPERLTSFDQWLEREEMELVQPQNACWKKAEHLCSFEKKVKITLRTAVICMIVFVIFSVSTGLGPLAAALGIHHPRLTAADKMTDLGDYAPVAVSDFNASSILGDDGSLVEHEDADPDSRFTDLHLMDGDTTTAWAEGEKNNGADKRIYVNIDKKKFVHCIVIYNGNQENSDTYQQYGRMKRVTLRLDAANKSYSITLKDTPDPQYIRVDETVDRFWIILGSSYKGKGEDKNITCCSEVEVY